MPLASFSTTRTGVYVTSSSGPYQNNVSYNYGKVAGSTTMNVSSSISGSKKMPHPWRFVREHLPGGYDNRSNVFVLWNALHKSYSHGPDPGPLPYGNLSSNLPSKLAIVHDRCLEKVYDQIRGNANLAVDLAESGATLKMLKNALGVRKLAKEFMSEVLSSRRYKRIRGPRASERRASYLSSKWLEYRYGWQPLVSSTYSLLEEIHRHRVGGLIQVKARSAIITTETQVSGDGSYSKPNHVLSFVRSDRCQMGIFFQLPDTKGIWDFTTLNPASIAWELLPYSFVADWFVNVSQQLSLWENTYIFSSMFRSGFYTYSSMEEIEGTRSGTDGARFTYGPPPESHLLSASNPSLAQWGRRRWTFMDRSILNQLPRPAGFRFQMKLNSKRLADAAALIWQQFSRK